MNSTGAHMSPFSYLINRTERIYGEGYHSVIGPYTPTDVIQEDINSCMCLLLKTNTKLSALESGGSPNVSLSTDVTAMAVK